MFMSMLHLPVAGVLNPVLIPTASNLVLVTSSKLLAVLFYGYLSCKLQLLQALWNPNTVHYHKLVEQQSLSSQPSIQQPKD